MVTTAEQERFDSKWTAKDGCHLWRGPLDKDGYGFFYFRKKNRRAHRVAFFMANGPIASGMVIDHVCKNRNCVNIAHLRMITVRENSLVNSNSIAARNAMRTHCKNGHEFDRKYGNQRYCSVCDAAKTKRLRAKWKAEADSTAC